MILLFCLLLLFFAGIYMLGAFSSDLSEALDTDENLSAKDYLIEDLELDFATGKVDKEEYDSLKSSLK